MYVDVQIDPVLAYTRGFDDFDFFSRIAVPDLVVYSFPVYYLAIHRMLVAARTREEKMRILRFALGLPRGFAKTTFIKILIAWFLCYDLAEFILIVCADESLAHNLLSDIDDILGSPNMEAIYGKWTINKAIDNKEKKTAMYRGKPRILTACGAGSSVRGLNIKNRRPDFILFDDMQSADNAKSDIESEALLDRFVGTFLKLVNPERALIVYIGNMYPNNCILARLRDNTQWVSLITGCILADGSSLWPELHPIEALYESFKHDVALGRGHIWFAEMMNDPIESRTSLLPDGILPDCPYTEEELTEQSVGGFIIIDPSGYRVTSDENVVAVHTVMDEQNIVMRDGIGGIMDPEQVILKAVQLAIDHNITIIGVESVAYQQTLKFWLDKYLTTMQMDHIQVVELSPAGRKKEYRIIAWFKEILAGSYHVAEPVRNRILWQALSYKIGKKENKDDWLDAGAYGMDMRAEYWDQIIYSMKVLQPSKRVAHVRIDNTPF